MMLLSKKTKDEPNTTIQNLRIVQKRPLYVRIFVWFPAILVTLACALYMLNQFGISIPSFLHLGQVTRTDLKTQITDGIAVTIEAPALAEKPYSVDTKYNDQFCAFWGCIPGTTRQDDLTATVTAPATVKLVGVKVSVTYSSDPDGAKPGHVTIMVALPAPVLPTSVSQLKLDVSSAKLDQNNGPLAFGSGINLLTVQNDLLNEALAKAKNDADLADKARESAMNILQPLVVGIVNSFNYSVDNFTITYSDGVVNHSTPTNMPVSHKLTPSTSPSAQHKSGLSK